MSATPHVYMAPCLPVATISLENLGRNRIGYRGRFEPHSSLLVKSILERRQEENSTVPNVAYPPLGVAPEPDTRASRKHDGFDERCVAENGVGSRCKSIK